MGLSVHITSYNGNILDMFLQFSEKQVFLFFNFFAGSLSIITYKSNENRAQVHVMCRNLYMMVPCILAYMLWNFDISKKYVTISSLINHHKSFAILSHFLKIKYFSFARRGKYSSDFIWLNKRFLTCERPSGPPVFCLV